MLSLQIKDLKFRCSLLEQPYFRHKSEVSDLGIKRHMFIKSDNRFALQIRDSFDPQILESSDEITLTQLDKFGNLIRKWVLSNPRFDSYVPDRDFYLIDCSSWSDETFDPIFNPSKNIEKDKEEFEELLNDLLK